jgi:nicotinamide-nucleotide amidase
MKAAILAVGSELLGTDRVDTNSLRLTRTLRARGVELVFKAVVGDDEQVISEAVRDLLGRADLLLVTGGLGPTADDVTRQGVAQACGRSLRVDDEVVREIEQKFSAMGLRMPALNRRQAQRIEGAEWIPNRRGTARGLRLEEEGDTIFLFPGVPVELEGMIESDLLPWLQDRTPGELTQETTLRTACLPESTVEERVAPAYERFGRETISILASPGEVLVKAHVTGSESAGVQRLQEMEAALRELLGDAVFAAGDTSLEEVVGDALRRQGHTVATAESCTGGLIAERITRVPGSSEWMLGGVVAYSNRIKSDLLDVEAASIALHGAVSREVAMALAAGARHRLSADWGIGVTGIAGPGGGSVAKPVGTVHVAVAGPASADIVHHGLRLPGDRQRVRRLSSQWGLDMLRRCLTDLGQLPAASTSPEYSG